jgi:hypothetical protein
MIASRNFFASNAAETTTRVAPYRRVKIIPPKDPDKWQNDTGETSRKF